MRNLAVALTFGASVCALAAQASAQTAQTKPVDPPAVGETSEDGDVVVVTADRREQNLQDYAGTAAVFGGDQIKKRGIQDITDFNDVIPGLTVANNGGNVEVWIRGVGSSNNTELGDPAAAFHFDGVYVPRPSGIGSAFFDIERVEVNFGPQGTLRGRNATAGSVNAIAWKPGIGVWDSELEAEYGNYNQKSVRGMMNVPIGDNAAFRFSGMMLSHDSYYQNVGPVTNIDVAEAEDNLAYRAQLLVKPSDRLSVLLAGDYIHETGTGWTGSNYANPLGNGVRPDEIKDPRQAFAAGVGSVMASFSSVNGQKMHASEEHLTGLLRGELGFKGPVVGDWNGHGELEGCTNADCPASLMAGLDVYMVPEDWKGLYETLLAQAKDGRIPLTRIDEAVLRVLRLKLAYGLFDKPRPSERQLAGDWERLGSDEHRELAREAVRKSLVLLKNNGVLPISASAKVLVAGPAADDVPRQTGGWSITWQGGGTLANADFRGSTSIFQGLSRVLSESGGTARLSVDGSYQERPDLAIVVFGEEAYAEFVGDRDDHVLRDEAGLRLLRRFKAEGIPTVAVLVSGRPLWSNRELALADAFVAAWLPGSEGTGVADVLVATQDKKPRYDFSGRLSFAWPKDCTARSEALFPLGAGGSYAAPPGAAEFDTACSLLDAGSASQRRIFERGLDPSVNASAEDAGGPSRLANLQGASPNGGLSLKAFDLAAQEDARRLVWSGPARLRLEWGEASLPEDATLVLRVRVPQRPSARLTLSAVAPAGASKVDLTSSFELAAGKDWRNLHIPVTCVGAGARGVTLEADAAFSFDVERISLVPGDPAEGCVGPF